MDARYATQAWQRGRGSAPRSHLVAKVITVARAGGALPPTAATRVGVALAPACRAAAVACGVHARGDCGGGTSGGVACARVANRGLCVLCIKLADQARRRTAGSRTGSYAARCHPTHLPCRFATGAEDTVGQGRWGLPPPRCSWGAPPARCWRMVRWRQDELMRRAMQPPAMQSNTRMKPRVPPATRMPQHHVTAHAPETAN